MAILNCPQIRRVLNTSRNGFFEITGVNIQEMAKLIQTAAGNGNAGQNPKSIASPAGELFAIYENMLCQNPKIKSAYMLYSKVLYARLAATAYRGEKVSFRTHTFDSNNALEIQCVKDFRKREGWKEDSEHLVEMCIDNRVCGVFVPTAGCFIPAAGFRETMLYGYSPEKYLADNPHVKNRYRAILTTVLNNGADKNIIGYLLSEVGGPMGAEALAEYNAEILMEVEADVANYICVTSNVKNASAACGYMGTKEEKKLLAKPVLINTGADAEIHYDMKKIGNEFVVIPPVKNTDCISEVMFRCGGKSSTMGIVTPSWIEFTAKLDEELYHQVYTIPEDGWTIKRPNNYVDLSYMVPDGILSKFNYLVKDPSEGPSLGMGELDCNWEVYPEDRNAYVAELTSKQYEGTWEILQRSSRITRMELVDADGEILGSIFPDTPSPFKKNNDTIYVSFDPAGAVSVRLATVAFSGHSTGISYTDLAHPITPMAIGEVHQIMESCTAPSEGQGTHFNSLLQTFFPTGGGGWSQLMVESRLWKPDQKKLFDSLKDYPGTMLSAMTGLGVTSNPKEMISRSHLKPAEKAACMTALEMYIGTMLFEAVVVLAREGYSIASGNLEFLVSYPENGSGEGVTKMMKKAIFGALEFVNEYLEPSNRLEINSNVTLHSESEATAQWHVNNPPSNYSMVAMVAAATPDIGHSTHDYSLRVNGHLYMFSIPYAAQNITNATLAKVYNGNADALMRCFLGGNPELMSGARAAITSAMKSTQGKLYERLGFILSLNQLFGNCTFNVTGQRADVFQLRVQQIVEAKLNIAIPAYADSIVRAVEFGDLTVDSDVLIAPVGKGSLAISNTADGFKERFIARLKDEISELLGATYNGMIDLLPNNDTSKVSVAQGLIDLKENGSPAVKPSLIQISDDALVEYYLSLVYGEDENEEKRMFRKQLSDSNKSATIAKYNELREKLYDNAFKVVIDGYTYEDFESSFNRWGYIGTGDGSFDDNIRATAKKYFNNLVPEMKQSKKDLIMACPRIEKEMVCGAMMDLVMER